MIKHWSNKSLQYDNVPTICKSCKKEQKYFCCTWIDNKKKFVLMECKDCCKLDKYLTEEPVQMSLF